MTHDTTEMHATTGTASPASRQSRTIGLVVDDGVPARIAATLAKELPVKLCREVQVATGRIPLDENGSIPMVQLARRYRTDNDWDIVVLITDVPMRLRTTPLVTEYSTEEGAALVSVPALGAVRLRHRLGHLLVPLIQRLAERDGRSRAGSRLTKRMGLLRAPVRHVPSDSPKTDQYVALAGLSGRLQMLLGIVRANRPWRLVPSLESATAAAAATAAFSLFYSGIWPMAVSAHPARLVLISALAITSMVVWFICYNRLWDRPSSHRERGEAVLFNISTVITLSIGVAVMYLLLYLVTLLGAISVIDSGYLQSQLNRPADPEAYARIVWLACSMGLVAGALGSSFDSEDAVRRAAYSRRERERQARQDQQHDRSGQIT
jgi:hypothetical protein